MNLFDFDSRTAAAVAAAGTVIGALAQLRVAWRKEVSERARGVPATKKSRRGPVLAVSLLLIAAAVCGFALSQYLVRRSDHEAAHCVVSCRRSSHGSAQLRSGWNGRPRAIMVLARMWRTIGVGPKTSL